MTRTIYIGRRRLSKGGKLVHAFREEGASEENFIYYGKAKASTFASCQIGTIYEIEDGKPFPAFWPNAKVGMVSEADAWAFEVADRDAELRSRKVESSPKLNNLVADLRAARQQIPHTRRATFDAWLLNAIR